MESLIFHEFLNDWKEYVLDQVYFLISLMVIFPETG